MTATRSLSATLQHLNRTLLADGAAELSDAELVARFVADRDEVAFTALVRRYGLLVFGVCRRVLRHEQDAEDAFQATFLVFARDAATVQRAGAVGNWLYGVAHNVARKARANRHRRAEKEHTAAEAQPRETPSEVPDDLREVLDRELGALPNKYRTPIVLCDLMGLTAQQAAEEVGCPPKTLGTRLTRGRALLAQRLTRRGVALSVAALVAVLAPAASAAVPPRLVESTASAAHAFANGSVAVVTPAVAALTTGVTNAMLHTSLKYALLACGLIAVAVLTGGPVWQHIRAAHASPRPTQPAASATAPNAPTSAKQPQDPNKLHRELHRYLMSLLPWNGANADSAVRADDKKDKPKPLAGTWAKKDGELKLTFEKDALKISPHGKDDVILIVCEYTQDKDGLVKAKITGHEGLKKEALAEKIPVGTEFSFKWKANKDEATLDEVKGEKADALKSHLEGTFEEKK